MRCECCDVILEDIEATARFLDVVDGVAQATRYVGMCRACQKWLPPEVTIITRPDLDNPKNYDDVENKSDYFDLGEYDDE